MTLLNWEPSILCWKLPLGALDDPMEAAVAGTLEPWMVSWEQQLLAPWVG